MPQTAEQRKISYAKNKDKIAAYKRRYYVANGEKVRAHIAEYRSKNKGLIKKRKSDYHFKNKNKLNAISRAWYHNNKDQASATARKNYLLNRRERIAKTALWQQSNPERSKELRANAKHRRRAREHGTYIGRISYKAIKSRNGMVCGICNLPIVDQYHYDHIIPISKGGPHVTDNIQLAHPKCNREKSDRI